MSSKYLVRNARRSDFPHLPDVERSAAALFRAIPAVAHFADGEPSLSVAKQVELCERGTLWVVSEEGESAAPWAFLAAEKVDDCLYLWELSVHADAQRQGLSKLLLDAATEHARSRGLSGLSLMTEREVPWNGPMYARKGFSETEPQLLGPGHERIAEHERLDGMDMGRRVMMVRSI